MQFLKHDKFEREFSKIKHNDIYKSLELIENLLEKQFDFHFPKIIIPPGKLHRVASGENYEIWKIEMLVKGLRPNQWPRIWFMINSNVVTFLSVGLHQDNYNNNQKDREATDRALDFLDF